MGLFDLVTFLEEEFSIAIPTEELTPRRFATVSNILGVIDEFRTHYAHYFNCLRSRHLSDNFTMLFTASIGAA